MLAERKPLLEKLKAKEATDWDRARISYLTDVATVLTSSYRGAKAETGRALGILRRDPGRVYAGIVLDHDLQGQIASEADRFLTGQDVVRAILRYVSPDVPVLVHSMNASQSVLDINK